VSEQNPNYINPRLQGFNDPQYQKDAAKFNETVLAFDVAYNAKIIAAAVAGLIPAEYVPIELRQALELARKHESDVDGMELPAELRPFIAIVKALLLIL
jgi:hypothetical protein